MLMRKPVMQLNHVVSSTQEETTIDITKTLFWQAFPEVSSSEACQPA
jgi:hypothetical protein